MKRFFLLLSLLGLLLFVWSCSTPNTTPPPTTQDTTKAKEETPMEEVVETVTETKTDVSDEPFTAEQMEDFKNAIKNLKLDYTPYDDLIHPSGTMVTFVNESDYPITGMRVEIVVNDSLEQIWNSVTTMPGKTAYPTWIYGQQITDPSTFSINQMAISLIDELDREVNVSYVPKLDEFDIRLGWSTSTGKDISSMLPEFSVEETELGNQITAKVTNTLDVPFTDYEVTLVDKKTNLIHQARTNVVTLPGETTPSFDVAYDSPSEAKDYEVLSIAVYIKDQDYYVTVFYDNQLKRTFEYK